MRNKPNLKIESARINGPRDSSFGAFRFAWHGQRLNVIASDGGGWDHVSVSCLDRCPTWNEMQWIKEQFFYDEEAVVQIHVPSKDHINNHPYCLHLWRPQSQQELEKIIVDWGDEWPEEYSRKSAGCIPLPPIEFVGVRGLELKV